MATISRRVMQIEGPLRAVRAAGFLAPGTRVPGQFNETLIEGGAHITRLAGDRVRVILTMEEAARRDVAFQRFIWLTLLPVELPSEDADGDG